MERILIENVPCKTKKYDLEIDEIIGYFNIKTSRNISPSSKKNYSLIIFLLRKGYAIEDFKIVIDIKFSQWVNNHTMKQYLRPETLFNRVNFPRYLQESKVTIDNIISIKEEN